MYSQEVRFYSSLVFFYYLSTLLLLAAIMDSGRVTRWILFLLTCVIGAYFHIFVLLSVLNGFVWTLFSNMKKLKENILRLSGSTTVAFLCILPGYLYFGSHQKFNYPLLPWGGSLLQEIAVGLGWYELPFVLQPGPGLVWYLFCLGLFIVGAGTAIRRSYKRLIALLISSIFQVPLIIAADFMKKYWFVYRQILFLHPFVLLLSSLGFCYILDTAQRINMSKTLKWIFKLAFTTSLIMAAFFSLYDYFRWPKSEARQISEYIVTHWVSPNGVILVTPGYQEKVYRFYLQYIFQRPDIATWVKPIEVNNLPDLASKENTFLIAIGGLPDWEISQLLQKGFSPVYVSKVWLAHSLFIQASK